LWTWTDGNYQIGASFQLKWYAIKRDSFSLLEWYHCLLQFSEQRGKGG